MRISVCLYVNDQADVALDFPPKFSDLKCSYPGSSIAFVLISLRLKECSGWHICVVRLPWHSFSLQSFWKTVRAFFSYTVLWKWNFPLDHICGTTFWWSPFQVRMQLCYTMYIMYSVGPCSCVALVLDVLSSDLFSILYRFGWLFSCLFEQRVSSCKRPRRRNRKHSRNSVLCLSINLHIYSLCLCQMSRNWGK